MLLTLLLYGSRARGDHRQKSDVDLLGVVESSLIHREVTSRGASFYHYPSETLLKKAKSGDLFVLHLVEEAKVLHDTLEFFETVRQTFRYKRNYRSAVREAHAVLKFLTERTSLLEKAKARKRLIWAIRTMIIARSAEAKQPVFSSRALELFSSIEGLKDIIDNRNTVEANRLISCCTEVEERFGLNELRSVWPSSKPAQRHLLKSLGGVAEDTLRFLPPRLRLSGRAVNQLPDIEYPI